MEGWLWRRYRKMEKGIIVGIWMDLLVGICDCYCYFANLTKLRAYSSNFPINPPNFPHSLSPFLREPIHCQSTPLNIVDMDYISKFLNRHRQGNQQSLIEATAQKSHDIVRNRLLVTSIVNLLTFLILIFSMSYYDWGRIEMPFYVLNQQQSDLIVRGYLSLYINLVYGKQMTVPYYQTYSDISADVCLSNDIFCQSVFQDLQCIGLICSILMGVGGIVQIYDIVAMIRYFWRGEEFGEEGDDSLRHFVTIGLYLVGITLNIFGLSLMEVGVFLGVSFWIFVGGVLLFIAVIIAEQISLANLRKQQLMILLMKQQKKISHNFNGPTIELSSQSDTYL